MTTIKNDILNHLTTTQLFSLIGAARAAGDAVHTAAERAVIANKSIETAMDLAIDHLTNFAAFMYNNDTLLSLMKYNDDSNQPFDEIDDEMLYAICGPVYFDYTWIFRQNPALIKHILGEDNDSSDQSATNQYQYQFQYQQQQQQWV